MRIGASVLTILALSSASGHANGVEGLYVGLGAGLSLLQDQTATALILGGARDPRFTGTVSFDPGYVGIGSVGWGFGNGIRAEIEGFYRFNSVSRYPGATSFQASEQAYGGFLNAFYDFDLGGSIHPYLGLGIGEQTVQYKNGSLTGPNEFIRLQHENPDIAYQGIVGASFDLPVPGLAATLEYRFVAQPTQHRVYGQYFIPNAALSAEAHLQDDYDHQFLVGLRYAFNAAPPPPPAPVVTPAPAREAARTYLVFFDWDRADLTPRARQVVAEAAQASTRTGLTRIELDGYTDRSGTPAYNQGLSLRRAQAVSTDLVSLGVPRAAISIQGFGETHPLVPTADGVREPQNRRVEIILR